MRDLRCLLRLHKWSPGRDEEGAKVIVCMRCGKREQGPEFRRSINL